MIEALSGLLNTVKQTSPAVFLGLAIASGILLFSGNDTLTTLGLLEFKTSNVQFIGASFILSISIMSSHCLFAVFGLIKALFKDYQKKQKRKALLDAKRKTLEKLTPDEKAYLAPYILQQESSQYFSLEDGVAGELIAKGILHQTSTLGDVIDGFAYSIQPWVREHLKNNPELLKGATPNIQKFSRW